MKRIDISKWGKFKIGELFEYDRGKESAPKQVKDWDCPMINETSENNGLTKYAKPTKVLKGNSISISVNFAQTVFYQPKDFCASDFVMSLYSEKLNYYIWMFIVWILRRKHLRYNYWEKISKDKLLEDTIYLPVNSSWEPDFAYMENYIKELETRERESILLISNYLKKLEEKRIDTSKWKEFRLGELFEVQRWNISNQRTIQESDKKDCVFVAQNEKDNGFVCYVEPNNNKIFNPSIIIWRQTWIIYYQPKKFITTDWVLILIWKNNTLSSLVSLFLVSVLKKYFINSWYSNPISAKQVSDLEIYLPVTSDNQIDYNYMENYIKNIQAKEREIMNFFK